MKATYDKKLLLIFVACLLLEVLVCNANSFRVWNSKRYERKTFTVDQMETSGFEVTGNILTYVADYGEEASITLKDIDTEVGTLYLDLYLPNENYLSYTLYYTDEANRYLMRNIDREYIPGIERTRWTTCHFSGKSEKLKIVFHLEDDLYQMAVDACVVNEPVKFRFHFLRFLIIFFIVAGCYLMRQQDYFTGALERKSQYLVLSILVVCFLAVMWSLSSHSTEKACVAKETGDMYSQGLTDALLSGQLNLHTELSERLQSLDNPYDLTERMEKGLVRDEDYIMDAAYYGGKYYVYFGIVPALLFVPFKWITGMYLSVEFVTFLFMAVYIVFMDLLFIKAVKKILPGTSFGMYITGLLMLNAGSMALCFVSRAKFYEMVYAVGFALSAIGLYQLFSAFWKEKKNSVQIFFGGLCLALAVGCRPTMILYSALLIPEIIRQLWRKLLKRKLLNAILLAVPYVLVAFVLMWYNYARFGNIFDFGQNYQLTVTDMAKDSYKLSTLPWCLWFGMFQPLSITAQFPFVFSGSSGNDFVGYFYNTGNVIPIFSGIPFLYTLFVPTFWKKWREKRGVFAFRMLGTVLGTGFAMAVVVFLSAGIHIRYTAEAVPLLLFTGIFLYCNYTEEQKGIVRRNLITVFYAAMLFTAFTAFLTGMVGERDWIFTNHPEFYYAVERAFCFWK